MFTIWSRENGLGARFVHLYEAMEHAKGLALEAPDVKFHVFQAHGWAMSTPSRDLVVMEGRVASLAA